MLEPDEYASNTYSSSINDNMLTMTQTVSYTLEDDVYRYVRLQDGLSIFDPNGIDSNDLKPSIKILGLLIYLFHLKMKQVEMARLRMYNYLMNYLMILIVK